MTQKNQNPQYRGADRRLQLALWVIALPTLALALLSIAESQTIKYTATASPADFGDLSKLRPEDFARLDRWLEGQVEDGAYPSISVSISTDEGVAHSAAFGWADRANNRRATTETLYQQASITKLFTATLATILHH